MKLDFDRQSPPLSFTIGDQSSNAVFSSWDRSKIDDGGWRYSDSETELAVEVTVRQFDDAKVVEWMVRFINDGDETSPIITDVLPLNFSWEMSEDDDLHLGHANGSLCRMDDFVPTTTKIRRGEEKTLEPMGGRSSNGVMPFFNVITDDGGFTVAVGWSGGWRSKLNRDDSGCRLIAGMTETSIALGPKESFRTPKMLLVEWDGTEPEIGDNAIRRLLLEHYIPQSEGEPALPPIAHPRQLVYYLTQKADEADHLEAVERAGELGLEAFWVDALWYGGGGDWWEEVGSWRVRKDRFPNGLKPIADAAHEKGMKFVLWFEPERVRAGTDIHRNHPEYLLSIDGDSDNFLYDLGNRDACEFMTDLISEIITEVGVDIYRQDCNIELLPYWEQADGPDQIGFTEAKHIEGLYWMWDELVRRHPGLLIDNCASGGRRIDLETTSRSFPLWRSDYTDIVALSEGMKLQIGAQCQTAGLSRWVPIHTAAVWTFDPYSFRSSMSTGVVYYTDILADDYPIADAKIGAAELRRLRPLFLGDFHLLIPLSDEAHDWCGYQFHRPDLGQGFALFLRRHESPFPTANVNLRGIDRKAVYEVTMATNYTIPNPKKISGEEFANFRAEVAEIPGSLLVEYRKVT